MIDFLRYKKIYFVVSGALLALSIFALSFWGLKLGTGFTGESILELKFGENSNFQLLFTKEDLGEAGSNIVSVRPSGDNFILRLKPIGEEEKNAVVSALGNVEVVRFETVEPTLGREFLWGTIIAGGLSLLFIAGYVVWRFRNFLYGSCMGFVVVYDAVILLGSFAVLGRFFGIEFGALFLTALLAVLSFSVHNTVLVLNNIWEEVGKDLLTVSNQQFAKAVNRAVNSTIVGDLNRFFAVIFVLLCLIFLGGQPLRLVPTVLLIGVVLSAYSSIFITAPLLILGKRLTDLR